MNGRVVKKPSAKLAPKAKAKKKSKSISSGVTAIAKRPAAQATTPAFPEKRAHTAIAKRPAAQGAKTAFADKRAQPNEVPALPLAVVVNLARRKDRWRSVSQRLSSLQELIFERVDAVDGDAGADIPKDVVADTWSTARNWQYVVRVFEGGEDCGYVPCELKLTGGERGCAASHVAIWRRLAADVEAAGPLVVLEDDARPTSRFVPALRQALMDLEGKEPDILYLGYTQAAPWRRIVSDVVREAEYLWTTVGYVLWPRGAQRLLAELPIDQPVDNYMAHLMATRKLKGFAIAPAVVKQAKAWNVDNDVGHSDDKAWKQNCQR